MRRRKRKEDQRTRHRARHKLRSRTRNLSSNQSQQLRKKKMMLPNQRNSRTPILVCPQGIYTSSEVEHGSSVKIEHREHTAKDNSFCSLPPSSLFPSLSFLPLPLPLLLPRFLPLLPYSLLPLLPLLPHFFPLSLPHSLLSPTTVQLPVHLYWTSSSVCTAMKT